MVRAVACCLREYAPAERRHEVCLAGSLGDVAIAVVDDPLDGFALAIDIAGRCGDQSAYPPLVIRASACAALDGFVFRNVRVSTNNIFHVEGEVSVNCMIDGGGGRLQGEVAFSACH